MKNCIYEASANKMSSGQIMTGMTVMIFQKKFHLTKPLTEPLENPFSKKMSLGQILYYDGYGSYNFSENFLSMKPLEEIEKNK